MGLRGDYARMVVYICRGYCVYIYIDISDYNFTSFNVFVTFLPRIYHVYNVRRHGAWVQVLLAVRTFVVPRPLPEWDRGHSVFIRWDDYPTVDAAWDFSKRVSGWP